MRKIPPMNAVRAFEAAARHISFTKAASELGVTHGAVSKQVAILEAWLNTPLFNRSPSQLSLTDAGRTLLAAATPALDRIAATATQLLEQASPSALRINAPPTFTMRWLIPRISSFQRKRPDVEIKFTTSIAPVNFQERSYDIAIRAGDQSLPGLRSIPFMTETIVPICHPDLLERGRLQSPADLAKHTLINYDTEPLTWPDWLTAASPCPACKATTNCALSRCTLPCKPPPRAWAWCWCRCFWWPTTSSRASCAPPLACWPRASAATTPTRPCRSPTAR